MATNIGYSVLFLICVCVGSVRTSGTIKVTITNYENPSQLDMAGRCCDGVDKVGCPTGRCDHSFELCVKLTNTGSQEQDCLSLTPEEDISKKNLTEKFSFDVLEETYKLIINVTDVDPDERVPVDLFNISINRNGTSRTNVAFGQRTVKPTRMEVHVEHTCDKYFYQADCSKKCVPANDCTGHYECDDISGDKICHTGWRGDSCTDLISGSEPDCSMYQDAGFVSSAWEGLVICPKVNRSISMNITKDDVNSTSGIPDVSGYVTIGHITVVVTGNYISFAKQLFLETQTNVSEYNETISQLDISASMMNQTLMNGIVRLNGEQCVLQADRLEGYFDACQGLGTCVRYGQKKGDYYCCCNGNQQATSCTTSQVSSSTSYTPSSYTSSTNSTPTSTQTLTSTTESTLEMTSQQQSTNATMETSSTESQTTSTTTRTQTTTTDLTDTATESTEQATDSTSELTSLEPTTSATTGLTSEITSAPSTSSGTSPTSEAPSSSEEPTSTAEPSSSGATSTSQEPSTTEATSSTTETTYSTTETPSTTTEPTTTEAPTVFEPYKTYSVELEADEEELEGEELVLEELLVEAWSQANTHFTELTEGSYNITVVHIKGGIGEDGVLMVEVAYTVNISSASLNVSELVSPTRAQLSLSVRRRYNLQLYAGTSFIYLAYSFSLYIAGRRPLVEQYLELDGHLLDLWSRNSSLENSTILNITTAATEEYIGPNGEEVARIYYFLYTENEMLEPANVSQPAVVSLGRYAVYQQDVSSLVRYRFTYSVNIRGELSLLDQTTVTEQIQVAWNETSLSSVRVYLLRAERYVTAIGMYVTKVLYITNTGSSTIMPARNSGPTSTFLEEHLQVNSSRGEVLQLYNGTDIFRYSFHLGLYVLGEVDGEHDSDKFLDGLESAWQSHLISHEEWESKMYKFHYVTVEKYISKSGRLVDMWLYFLTKRGQIIDGTQFQELPLSNLSAHVQVRRGDGQLYTLTTGTDLVEERLHLTVLFRGVVVTSDLITVTRVLLDTWNLTLTAANTQKILVSAYEELITETGELVTRIYYTYYEDKMIVRPVDVAEYLPTFHTTFGYQLTLLTSLHVQYEVYTGPRVGLVSRRSLTPLYFTSEVARLDYTLLQTRLSAYLNLYLGLTDIEVTIRRQEEYYVTNSTTERCWKLYLVIMKGSTTMYPSFYKTINSTDLSERLNVTALTDRKYTLYTGEMTALRPYFYHFQLHFRERVSEKDCFRITAILEASWNAQYGVNVSVQIGRVEEVISTEGTTYWRLVYFLSWKASEKLIYSGSWKKLDVTMFTLDFTNAMGTTYTVVDYSLPLWRVSSAFRLLTSTSLTESYTSELTDNLKSTWCETITNLGRNFNCNRTSFTVIRPQYIKLSSGISVWRLYYFIEYDGFTVASLSWPTFDLDTFKISIRGQIPAMFYHWTDLDLSFWNFRFFLHFKSRLAKTDYAKVEASIIKSWRKENKATNAKAVIDTQTEVITETGAREWRIGYHIEVNGTIIRPEETFHVNTTELRTSLKAVDAKLDISTSTNMTYIAKENMAALYVRSKIHKEDYEKFRLSLEQYYRNNTGGKSNISVVLGPMEEVITSEGKSEWKLTYTVKKDGETIHSKPIAGTEEKEFSTWFNFKSKFGLGYKFSFSSKKERHSQSTILGINLKAKVSKSKYSYMEEKLSEAITAINTDLTSSSLSVKILGQREMVTETGETTWRVDYGVYINGTRVDASFLVAPSTAELQKRLLFEGTRNSVVDISSTQTQSYLSLHELHFNRPVAALDLVNVTSAVEKSWASILNVSVSELQVEFKKSKEYVDKEGKSFWSWTYSLKFNSTILTRLDLSVHEKELKVKVKAEVEKIQTTKGDNYVLVDTTEILEYSKHFPLYFAVKVAKKDFIEIKQHLEKVWTEERGVDVQIDVLKQQELVDNSGKSYWELVYFVTSNDTAGEATVLDSRVEESHNVTTLLSEEIANMTDVNGYAYEVMTSVGKLYRTDLAFSLFLSAKFGVTEEIHLREYIDQTVRQTIDVNENETVAVQFLKVEEITTGTFESAWRYLVSISVDGKVLHPLSSLTETWPRLDLTTSTGQHLTIASIHETVYTFRSSFSFLVQNNISFSSWQDIKIALTRAWEKHGEYTNCSCLDFVLGSIHEVVDRSGKTFFKILYFVEQNGTIVDSLTTRKLDVAILKSELIDFRSVDGETNTVVDIKEELVTRVDTLFSFHLTRKVMITDIQKLEVILQQEFSTKMNTSKKDLSVSILRQARYLTVTGETVWRVEYLLRQDNRVVDALVTQQVNTSTIQSQLSIAFGAETRYVITEFKRHQIIDYRHKVELFFSSPIATENFVNIEMALNNTYSLPSETNFLFRSEELIDIYGMSVWQVSAFIYYGAIEVVPYVPGWGFYGGYNTINMTTLRSEIESQNITGASGHVSVLEITGEGLRHRESSLSVLVKNVIKTVDTQNISLALESHWVGRLSSSVNTSVLVDIARQEELVDIHGNVISRLVYYLTMDGTVLTSQDISPANPTDLQEVLTSYLTTGRQYEVVIETDIEVFQYESLFVFYMTSPILLYDLVEFETRLETSWQQRFVTTNLTNVTTNILLQEEMISSSISGKIWKISYSLHRESMMVDSRSIVGLDLEEVKSILITKFNKTSTDYSSPLLTSAVPPSAYLYRDLFSIHLRHRVATVDYLQFEASLELFWEGKIMNVSAKILRQEEELEVSGESVWRLSYIITGYSQIVSSTKVVQSKAEHMNRVVNVTSPSGVTYAIVDVTESVRIEEMFSLHITRKLYRGDVTTLLASVRTAVQTLTDGGSLDMDVERKGQTEFRKKLKPNDESTSVWRQLFLVKMGNKYITPLSYGSLTEEKITLNFTSVKGDNYETLNVASLSALYSRADMQYTLTVNGRIKEKDYEVFYRSLAQSWNETYKGVITINVQSNEEYIGDNGAVISRISLFALNGTNVIDPDTMVTPHVDNILTTLKTNGLTFTAYTGNTAVRHQTCFTLLLKGGSDLVDITDIKDTIEKAWVNTTGENDRTEVILNKREMFVGEFGVTLTNILYTVRINGKLSQTDDDIPPTVKEIEAQKNVTSSWNVYSKKTLYRLDEMFEVKIQVSAEMKSEQVATVESGLFSAWMALFPQGSCGACEIRIVRGESLLTSNSTNVFRVTNLRYTLKTQSRSVTPWTKDPPTNDQLTSSINNQSTGVFLWTKGDNLYTTREVFLSGYTSKLDRGNVSQAIQMAWATKTGVQVTKVTGQVSHTDLYSDTEWNRLTRVQFYVSVDSKDPPVSASPSTEEVNSALDSVGVGRTSCGCTGLKLRRLYVKGTSHNYSAIASAIRQTWISTNNDTSSLSSSLAVRLKQQSRRRRAVPTTGLVDDNGESVSPLDYTVTVEGEDPNPLFVQQPSQEDLDRSLNDAGADNCNCKPGKVDRIKLKGETKNEEKNDIADAIKNAVAKSNPDIDPADLSVQILGVSNNKEDGKPVSDVTYAVRRTDGDDVEALSSPSEAHLSEALEAAGKSLASHEVVTKKPTTQEIDWVVPVAVVCGLAGFVVICIIGFYFIYVRRHRKNADLKRTQRNIENNIHDEEHFTNPVMFNNPMYGTPKSKHQTVHNDGL